MPRPAPPLGITRRQRDELQRIARSSSLPVRSVRLAEALLLAADGVSNVEIARRHGVSPHTVSRWRARFSSIGLDWLRLPEQNTHQSAHASAGSAMCATTRVQLVGLYLSPGQRVAAVVPTNGHHPDRHPTTAAAASGLSDRRCHSYRDLLHFLKTVHWHVESAEVVNLVADRRSEHLDHYEVDRWLRNPRHRRFRLHVTSNPSAWVRLVTWWIRPAAAAGPTRPRDTDDRLVVAISRTCGRWVTARRRPGQ